MRGEAYVLLMLKQLSARGSLFLFVRTHHHLEYYFNLSDIRLAANQQSAARESKPRAKVVEFRGSRTTALLGPA
jgi:hypothetical protein